MITDQQTNSTKQSHINLLLVITSSFTFFVSKNMKDLLRYFTYKCHTLNPAVQCKISRWKLLLDTSCCNNNLK
jgi:hypothetical protein